MLKQASSKAIKLRIVLLMSVLIGLLVFMFMSMYAPHSIESIAQDKLQKASFHKTANFSTRIGLWETAFNNLAFQKGQLQGLIDEVTLYYSWPKIQDRSVDSALIKGASFSVHLNENPLFNHLSSWSILTLEKHLDALPTHTIFLEDSTLELWKNKDFIILNLKGSVTQSQQGTYNWTLSAVNPSNKLQFSGKIDPLEGLQSMTTVMDTGRLSTALAILNPQTFPLNPGSYSIQGKRTRIESFVQVSAGIPQDWILLTKTRAPAMQMQGLYIYTPKLTSITKGSGEHWSQTWSLARKVVLKQQAATLTLDRLRLHQKQEGITLAQLEGLEWEPNFKNIITQATLQGPIIFEAKSFPEAAGTFPGEVLLKEASFSIKPFNVSLNNIKTKLSLLKPYSLESESLAHIEASSGTIGIFPLKTTHMELDFKSPNKTKITRATAQALGGKIYFKGLIKTQDSLGFALAMKVEGIQMDELAQLFPQLNGLFVGTLEGELTVHFKDNTLYFEPTTLTLKPSEEAHISYTEPGWLTRQVPQDHDHYQNYVLAERAFEDLKLQSLTLALFQDEDYPIKASIEGTFSSEDETIIPLAIELNLSTPWYTLNEWAQEQGLQIEFKDAPNTEQAEVTLAKS